MYEVADHPDMVIKASTFNIKDILYENADNGEALDFFYLKLKKKNYNKRQMKKPTNKNFKTIFWKRSHANQKKIFNESSDNQSFS